MSERESHTDPGDAFPEGESFRLLFVCTGNTCRSPLSEAIARRSIERRGWKGVEVRSAGIAAFPGGIASDGALRTAKRHGLDLSGHRARLVTEEWVDWADLILTMSPGHLSGVVAAGGGGRSSVITSFARGLESEADPDPVPVADPFGGADPEYEATYEELSRLIEQVLDRLAPVVAP